jgi:hypothetical protein
VASRPGDAAQLRQGAGIVADVFHDIGGGHQVKGAVCEGQVRQRRHGHAGESPPQGPPQGIEGRVDAHHRAEAGVDLQVATAAATGVEDQLRLPVGQWGQYCPDDRPAAEEPPVVVLKLVHLLVDAPVHGRPPRTEVGD